MELLTGEAAVSTEYQQIVIREKGGNSLDSMDEWARNTLSLRELAALTNLKYAIVVLFDVVNCDYTSEESIARAMRVLYSLSDTYTAYSEKRLECPVPVEGVTLMVREIRYASDWITANTKSNSPPNTETFVQDFYMRAMNQMKGHLKYSYRPCIDLCLLTIYAQITRRAVV